nr:MAG: hypothetical protein [Bacteriophage sp.]
MVLLGLLGLTGLIGLVGVTGLTCSTVGAGCSVTVPVGTVTGLDGTTGLLTVCCSVTPVVPSIISLLCSFLA